MQKNKFIFKGIYEKKSTTKRRKILPKNELRKTIKYNKQPILSNA